MSLERALSSLSVESQPEDDWDRSLAPNLALPSDDASLNPSHHAQATCPTALDQSPTPKSRFTKEEASRIADDLGEWINASSSPYEADGDHFSRAHSQDDIGVASKLPVSAEAFNARPRGESDANPPKR